MSLFYCNCFDCLLVFSKLEFSFPLRLVLFFVILKLVKRIMKFQGHQILIGSYLKLK